MTRPSIAAWLLWLAGLGLALAVTRARYQPPAPAALDAPPHEFSAARAHRTLATLLGPEAIPRTVGTPALEAFRGRLEFQLATLGLPTTRQATFACGPHGTCAEVENVVARVAGTGEAEGLLLAVAHIDSAFCSPGAADDGLGVAALVEIARALKARPLRHDTLLLFADGEEGGLVGAAAFAAEHPDFADVRAAVNLDGRGSEGPAYLFETSPGSAPLIAALAPRLRRPVASSIFQDLYRTMPTDTDLSPLLAAGVQGVNFAFVRGVSRYHTPRDRLEFVDLGTLQHEGEAGLAALRAFDTLDLPPPGSPRPSSDAVFFDLFATSMVWMPVTVARALHLFACLLLGLALQRLVLRGDLTLGAMVTGAVAGPLALVGAAALGLATGWVLVTTGATPGWWPVDPTPGLVAYAAAGLAAVAGTARLLGPRVGPWGLWAGVAIPSALLGGLAALRLPGALPLLTLPTAAAAALVLLSPSHACPRPRLESACLPPALLAAALWVPMASALYDAGGFALKLPIACMLAALWLPGLPLFLAGPPQAPPARLAQAVTRLALATLLVALAWAATLDPYTPTHPQRARVLFHQDADGGDARWLCGGFFGPVPGPLAAAAAWGDELVPPLPWSVPLDLCRAAPAPRWSAPGPTLELRAREREGDGQRTRLRLHLTSPRGAREAGVVLPPEVEIIDLRVGGQRGPTNDHKAYDVAPGWRAVSVLTLPAGGIDLELVVPTGAEVPVHVWDRTRALEAPGHAALVAQRPEDAVTSHLGDVAILTRVVRLQTTD